MLRAAGREPLDVVATAVWQAPGVDRSLAGFLDFGGGLAGAFDVSFELPVRQRLEIAGTDAMITAEWAFNPGTAPTTLELTPVGGEPEVLPFDGASAYLGMVDHVHAVVLDGVRPRHGRDETLGVARTLDRARAAATR
jgi:hypothetical protein